MFRLRYHHLLSALLIGVTAQSCALPGIFGGSNIANQDQAQDGTTVEDDPKFQSEREAQLLAVPVDIDADLTKVITTDRPAYVRKKLKKVRKDFTTADGSDAVELENDPSALHIPGKAPPSLNARARNTGAKKGMRRRSGANGEVISYTVKSDDTLMKIAFEVFGNLYRWREIYEDNKAKIGNFNRLVKGTVLTIRLSDVTSISRNGEPYLIIPRDTLIKISNKLYGTPKRWWNLWDNNRELIHDPNKIYAGFTLYYRLLNSEKSFAEKPAVSPEESRPVMAATPEDNITDKSEETTAEAPRAPAAAGFGEEVPAATPEATPEGTPETAPSTF